MSLHASESCFGIKQHINLKLSNSTELVYIAVVKEKE